MRYILAIPFMVLGIFVLTLAELIGGKHMTVELEMFFSDEKER